MKWKQHFSEIILERGYGYFLDGNVEDLKINPDGYTASVRGTEDYQVEIELNDGSVSDMFCSCPYAEDGNNCKHMAAVLFTVEKGCNKLDIKVKLQDRDNELNEIKELLETVTAEQLKLFVLEQMRESETLRHTFRLRFAKNVSEEEMRRYKLMIHQMFDAHAYGDEREYGYSEYYDDDEESISEFIDEVRDFVDKYIEVMLEKQEYESAFWLISEIALALDKYDICEYEDISDEIAEICREYWSYIIEKSCDKALKNKVFEWFQESLFNLDAAGNAILSLYMTHFFENEYFNGKLKTVERKIQLLESRQTVSSFEYELAKWVLVKLELMRHEKDDASCCKIEEQYWRLPEIRKMRLEQCLDNGEKFEAIRILEESRIIDDDKLGLVIDYCRQIRELYRELGDTKNCRKEARNLLQYAGHDYLDDFRKWKALCNPDEWETEREEFFDSIKDNKRIKELYFEEKLYDRLMDCLMKSTTEWELSGYENALKTLYPNELLAWYEADVRRRAEQAGGREHYKHLVDSLIHMRKYPNGKEQVNAIVNRWRCIYKRRPAMMEELKKKGL